jgi:Dipeptidyl peptidase IV (DPP IV) N-terminal region
VVSADGGPTVWLKVPGDPRNNYIARLDWAASSDEVVLQHLNRRQNTDEVMLGDAATGDVHTVLTERDSAWVDVVDDLRCRFGPGYCTTTAGAASTAVTSAVARTPSGCSPSR